MANGPPPSRRYSTLAFTASALNGSPSVKVMPSWSVSVSTVLSSLYDHSVAMFGSSSPSGVSTSKVSYTGIQYWLKWPIWRPFRVERAVVDGCGDRQRATGRCRCAVIARVVGGARIAGVARVAARVAGGARGSGGARLASHGGGGGGLLGRRLTGIVVVVAAAGGGGEGEDGQDGGRPAFEGLS